MNRRGFEGAVLAVMVLLTGASLVHADEAFNQSPINYSTTQSSDPVQRLKQRIAAGTAHLTLSPNRGFLESLLRELNIPVSSQTLVFSKTSFQRDRISPHHPRAIYFDDETYVGYVPGGDDIEIATTDPAIGTVFYTVSQHPEQDPKPPDLVRETDNCLACHAASATRDIPGLLMRSTFPDSSGLPILPAGTFVTTQESPIKERWGGWYASGIAPAELGMANAIFEQRDEQTPPLAKSAQLQNASDYPVPRSDAVALMILAHQTEAHNRFTRAAYATRLALRDEKVLADALGEARKPGVHSDSTISRVKSGCDPLVEYLLFSNESPMPAGLQQSAAESPFIADFVSRGPRDPQGRSLRELDLATRLFRYPCSYLIYSASFDELPEVARDYTYRRMWEILNGRDTTKAFTHLSAADRQAILEILRTTKPQLPGYWRENRQ